MPEYRYAKGRIAESVQFISAEMKEFDTEYADKGWKKYKEDTKLQKLIDRTVENILTALIEICGTILTEECIAVESYANTLEKCSRLFGFTKEQQEKLAKLAVQRNRFAHRYLNFRWQAVKMFSDYKKLVSDLLTKVIKREEKR